MALCRRKLLEHETVVRAKKWRQLYHNERNWRYSCEQLASWLPTRYLVLICARRRSLATSASAISSEPRYRAHTNVRDFDLYRNKSRKAQAHIIRGTVAFVRHDHTKTLFSRKFFGFSGLRLANIVLSCKFFQRNAQMLAQRQLRSERFVRAYERDALESILQ